MKFKKIICTVALCSIGLSNSVFASDSENNNNTVIQSIPYEINLIEDNGETYQEIIIDIGPDLRASGSHSTTYEMTGGLYTQTTWNASSTPTFYVDVTPTYFEGKDSNVNMTIFLERNLTLNFWTEVDRDSANLTYGGNVKLKGDGSGKYRIYLLNNSRFLAKGDIEISYSWED